MSINIDENNDGTIRALGCHVDLAYDEVIILAEYTPPEPGDDNNLYRPSRCKIDLFHIPIRRTDELGPKIDRCWFGANVIADWEAQIIDEIEKEE